MGDLKSDLLTNSSDANFVRNSSDELSVQRGQHGSAYFSTSTSRTWIDVILVVRDDCITSSRNLATTLHSKHKMIDVALKVYIYVAETNDILYRDLKGIPFDK